MTPINFGWATDQFRALCDREGWFTNVRVSDDSHRIIHIKGDPPCSVLVKDGPRIWVLYGDPTPSAANTMPMFTDVQAAFDYIKAREANN